MALRRVLPNQPTTRKENMTNDSGKLDGVITSPPATWSACGVVYNVIVILAFITMIFSAVKSDWEYVRFCVVLIYLCGIKADLAEMKKRPTKD